MRYYYYYYYYDDDNDDDDDDDDVDVGIEFRIKKCGVVVLKRGRRPLLRPSPPSLSTLWILS